MADNGKVTLKDVYDAISALRTEIKEIYVTKDEFAPVRNVVYGLVALILASVIGALLTLLFSR